MKNDSWSEDFNNRRAERSDDEPSAEPGDDQAGDAARDEMIFHFCEQIERGEWPVKMPMRLELCVGDSRPRVRRLRPGESPSRPSSRIITIMVEFDREKVCEMMLEKFHSPPKPGSSRLPQLAGIQRVDHECFLRTGAAYFAETLADTGDSLRGDRWLLKFLGELHDHDEESIPELVSKTIAADRAAGTRLRDVILDALAEPHTREQLGWLVAGAITDRLQEL
jgi:hypothetical protein